MQMLIGSNHQSLQEVFCMRTLEPLLSRHLARLALALLAMPKMICIYSRRFRKV